MFFVTKSINLSLIVEKMALVMELSNIYVYEFTRKMQWNKREIMVGIQVFCVSYVTRFLVKNVQYALPGGAIIRYAEKKRKKQLAELLMTTTFSIIMNNVYIHQKYVVWIFLNFFFIFIKTIELSQI